LAIVVPDSGWGGQGADGGERQESAASEGHHFDLFAFFISDKNEIKIPGITMFVASGFYAIALAIMVRSFMSYPEKKESVNKEEELENLIGEEPEREDV